MLIGDSTLIEAGLTLMSLQSIFMFSSRGNISVVVTIVFSHLTFNIFTGLAGRQSCTGSTIRRRSSARLTRRWRRWRSSLCRRCQRRACWNWRRRATHSFLSGLRWGLRGSRVICRSKTRIEMLRDRRAGLRSLTLVCHRIQRKIPRMN